MPNANPPPLPSPPAARHKTGWRIGALVALAASLGVLCIVLLYGYHFHWQASPTEQLVQVDSLRVGDCFAERPEDDEADYVDFVIKQSCQSAYHRKIYAATTLRGSRRSFPGDDLLDEIATDYCLGMFYPTQGQLYEDSDYYFGYYYPSASSWKKGDHEILCYVYLEEETEDGYPSLQEDTVRISL